MLVEGLMMLAAAVGANNDQQSSLTPVGTTNRAQLVVQDMFSAPSALPVQPAAVVGEEIIIQPSTELAPSVHTMATPGDMMTATPDAVMMGEPAMESAYMDGYRPMGRPWHDWWCPQGNLNQRHPYTPRYRGYYYFKPEHFAELRQEQLAVQRWGADPHNVTDNRFLERINDQLLEELAMRDAETVETPEPTPADATPTPPEPQSIEEIQVEEIESEPVAPKKDDTSLNEDHTAGSVQPSAFIYLK